MEKPSHSAGYKLTTQSRDLNVKLDSKINVLSTNLHYARLHACFQKPSALGCSSPSPAPGPSVEAQRP